MKFVQTNLSDHHVLEAKQILQIVDEDALNDESAYTNKILFYFDLIRIK
jgi:hypothetical protein